MENQTIILLQYKIPKIIQHKILRQTKTTNPLKSMFVALISTHKEDKHNVPSLSNCFGTIGVRTAPS